MFDWILKGGQIPSFSCVLGLLVNFKPNGDQSDFQLNFRHLLMLKVICQSNFEKLASLTGGKNTPCQGFLSIFDGSY